MGKIVNVDAVPVTKYLNAIETMKLQRAFNEAPEAITECKYCEHSTKQNIDGTDVLFCKKHLIPVSDDFFCADGVKESVSVDDLLK